MGRDLHFKLGSFYRVDDRSGFPTRAERTRKEWQSLIVDRRLWEARQPQDLVKGVADYQAVPDPRSISPNVFVGPTEVQLAVNAPPQATTLVVQSSAGFNPGTTIAVMLADGSNWLATVTGVPDGVTLTIYPPLKLSAPSGNLVTNLTNLIGPP